MLASLKRLSPPTVLVLGFAFAASASAQSFTATHAKVSMIAENNSWQPGKTALVGVLFDLEKGWHIYWVNPGDSGQAPTIKWQLPAGFQAKEIRWPTPSRLGAGKVIDYGYEGRVLLPVPMQIPASYQPAKPATLSADIRYLICREVCIPAKAQASLSIPSANPNGQTAQELFRSTFDNSPKPWPAGWKAQASWAGDFFLLSLDTGTSESKATFFPLKEDQIDNAAPQTVTTTARGVQIKLKISSQLVVGGIPILSGIVVFGPGRAFEISAPVAGKK